MPQRNNQYKIGRTPGSMNRAINSADIKYMDRVLPNFKNIKVIDNKNMIGLKQDNSYALAANNPRPKRMTINTVHSNNPNFYTYATNNNEYMDIYKKTRHIGTNNMGTLTYNSGVILDNRKNDTGNTYMNANIHSIIETNKRHKEKQIQHEMKESERQRKEELEKSKQNNISLSLKNASFVKNVAKPIEKLIIKEDESKDNEQMLELNDFDDNASDDTDMIDLLSDEWSDSDNDN